jgi:HPt (histidine-containing phosphotransfer) domain-containing protein
MNVDDGGALLDTAVLADLRASIGDDEAFLRDLIETYVLEGTANLAALRDAAGAADAAAAIRPAHTLKSSSASIGALRLADLCREIEASAREERAEGLAERVQAVDGTWLATLTSLRETGLLA